MDIMKLFEYLVIYKSEITPYNTKDTPYNLGEEKDKYNFVIPSMASDRIRVPGPSSRDGLGKWMEGTLVKGLKSCNTNEKR